MPNPINLLSQEHGRECLSHTLGEVIEVDLDLITRAVHLRYN
jgi:hypothetical protein